MPVKADLTYHANPDRPFLRADSQYAFSGRAGILFAKEFARLFPFFSHRGRRGAYLLGVTCSKPWMTSSLWEGSGAPGFLLVRLTTEHELATRVHQRHCEKGCQVKKNFSILLPTFTCTMANTNPRLLILCRDPKHDRQKRAKIVTV